MSKAIRRYTPFLRERKMKEIDGVYRHKESGGLMILRNVILRGFIDCEKSPEEPYDGYWAKYQREGEAPIKRVIIEPCTLVNEYEKVFDL